MECRWDAKETQLMLCLSQTNEWRAGCVERRKSGSVRGVEKLAVLWENQSWSQPMQRALLLLYRNTLLEATEEMIGALLVSPNCAHLRRIESVTSLVNGCQRHYRLETQRESALDKTGDSRNPETLAEERNSRAVRRVAAGGRP